jgi:hypothetical protein
MSTSKRRHVGPLGRERGELGGVGRGRVLRGRDAGARVERPHRVHVRRREGVAEPVDQRGPRLGLVAVAVAVGQEPLVAPPQVHAGPVDGAGRGGRRHGGERLDPDGPAGEHDVHRRGGGLQVHEPRDEPRGRGRGERVGVRVHQDGARRARHAPTFVRPLRSTSP